tara:strand:- start:70 stop:1845 length:1776 start_codon:yes stop_codon:yes gene_type:complete
MKYLLLVLLIPSLAGQELDRFDPSNRKVLVDSLNNLAILKPDRSIRLAYEILEKYAPGKNDRTLTSTLNTLGEVHVRMGQPAQALNYFIDAKKESKLIGQRRVPWIDVNIGNVYFQERQWLEAKFFYLAALDDFNKTDNQDNRNGKAVTLNNLGLIESKLENYHRAKEYFLEALSIKEKPSLKIKNKNIKPSAIVNASILTKCHQYLLLEELYIVWGMRELAIQQNSIIDSMISELEPYVNELFTNRVNRYLGLNKIYGALLDTSQMEYQSAIDKLIEAGKMLKDNPIQKIRSLEILSDIYILNGDNYKAMINIDDAISIAMLNDLRIHELDLSDKKVSILKNMKTYKTALDISRAIKTKREYIEKERMRELLKGLQLKSELYGRRLEIKKVNAQKLLYYGVMGTLLVIVGLVIMSYRNARARAKQLVIIRRQEQKIAKSKLRSKEDELAKMSTYIVAKNELLSSLMKDVEYHQGLIDNKDDKKTLTPLVKRLKEEIDDSGDWERFQLQFSSAYPGFISYLTSKYLELSSGDIKLCCYLKMNMNTKDVAQLTGLSVRAVENKRYRLRKKLSLNKDTNLLSFLNQIINEQMS